MNYANFLTEEYHEKFSRSSKLQQAIEFRQPPKMANTKQQQIKMSYYSMFHRDIYYKTQFEEKVNLIKDSI